MSVGNTITITGNTVREPELRFAPSGQAVCNFGVAVNRRWQNLQTKEWEETVSFFDVVAWGVLGENTAECIAKGTRVTVVGRLQQRSYETHAGEKRSKVEIVADDVATSLRWARVEVTKLERDESAAPTTRAYDPNEEPF